MKKLLLLAGIVSGSLAMLGTGCVERRVVYVQSPPVVTQPQVVTAAPPAPQPEKLVGSPGPGYVWQPGYWSWQGRWVWVRGAWVLRPHPNAVWVPGHWEQRGRGWVWINGYWR